MNIIVFFAPESATEEGVTTAPTAHQDEDEEEEEEEAAPKGLSEPLLVKVRALA